MERNPSLLAIDKFNYLKTLLEGIVVCSIQGSALPEANYTAAVETLKENFGKKQIISGNMENLLNIPFCPGDKNAYLCLVYDKVYANVCGLEVLGIHVEK